MSKKSWLEIYTEEINSKGTVDNYVKDKVKNKKVLIKLIKKFSPNKKIIEAGSGTGIMSTYMASIGFDSLAIDIDKDILNLSKKISEDYNSISKPRFKIDSILELDYKKNEFDVSFSNGVLEHFSDKDIIVTLKKQMKIAKYVIVGIPTKYFNTDEAMFGDERFLDLNYWRILIKKSGGNLIEEKSCHFMGIRGRILDFKKYFRPYPFRIFVIEKK